MDFRESDEQVMLRDGDGITKIVKKDGSKMTQWLDWPVKDLADATRPRGVRLRVTLAERGEFERIYYLP